MGGTRRPDVHSLAALLLVCGDGTSGCHGWIEQHRAAATDRGLLVPMGINPTDWPLTLASGRRVQLDDVPEYLPPADGIPYAV